MKEIIIIGAGDFGKEVAWLIEDINKITPTYIILGFLDDTIEKIGTSVNGYNVLGPVSCLPDIIKKNPACATIAIQNSQGRKKIVDMLPDFDRWETLIHPNVNISETSRVGIGSIICSGVNISVNSSVGNFSIINIGSVIENDCVVDDYASVMCKTVVGSHSIISHHAYLGSNCTVTAHRTIGVEAQVGPGSVVVNDIAEGTTVIGVPAKKGLFDGERYSYL
ncbi:MAG: hypothetical protein K5769_09980 [Pseudobutyrivibrio sp.]|nr:hypothetical protein [Pseudobutyrivibrio sp.]